MKTMKPAWTDAENAILRKHYPTLKPMDDIVAMLDRRSVNAVWKQAYELRLKRPGGVRNGINASDKTVTAMTLAARPDGVGRMDLGNSAHDGELLNRLARKERLYRGVLGHRTVRYFSTEKAANRWVAANLPTHQAKQALHIGKPKTSPEWAPDAQIHYPKAPDGTLLYKVTICPSPAATMYRTATYSDVA